MKLINIAKKWCLYGGDCENGNSKVWVFIGVSKITALLYQNKR